MYRLLQTHIRHMQVYTAHQSVARDNLHLWTHIHTHQHILIHTSEYTDTGDEVGEVSCQKDITAFSKLFSINYLFYVVD